MVGPDEPIPKIIDLKLLVFLIFRFFSSTNIFVSVGQLLRLIVFSINFFAALTRCKFFFFKKRVMKDIFNPSYFCR